MGFPIKEAREIYGFIKKESNIELWQERQKWDVVDYHLNNNLFYKKLVGYKPSTWTELPILKKSDLQGDFMNMIPSGLKVKDLYVSNTSGSSGHPFFFAKDKLSHALVWINVEDHYNKAGISINDKQARFYGVPLDKKTLLKERIKDRIANRYRFVVFNLEDKILDKWLRKFEKTQFKYLYGYTNSLLVFAKYLLQKNIILVNICKSIKGCIVTSELCMPEDRKLLEMAFGVKVYNEYGASELSVIGFMSEDVWEVSDEVVMLEVVNENDNLVEDGTVGRLICTLLHNKATPIIRYEVGDMAAIKKSNGRTYITTLAGRENEMAQLPSGKKVPGFTFYYVARSVLEKSDSIKEYRIIRSSNIDFEVQVVTNEPVSNTLEELVQHTFDKYLEPGLNVKIVKIEHIDRSGNGKFKHFISKI